MDQEASGPVVFFGSLETSAFARRLPNIGKGVWRDEDKLRASRFLPVAGELALNSTAVFVPFGLIETSARRLRTLYGDRVFMRPDASTKRFTGFDFSLDDVSREISFIRQVSGTHDDELMMIDAFRELTTSEIRFWVSDGEIISSAWYHQPGNPTTTQHENEMRVSALSFARRFEAHADPVVIDFVMLGDAPKLVEVNGFQTSGIYAGADANRIFSCAASYAA